MASRPTPRTPARPAATPAKSRLAASTLTPARIKSPSSRSTSPVKPSSRPPAAPKPDAAPTPALSIKEAIALRRAEAKKAQAKVTEVGSSDFIPLEDASPVPAPKQEEEDILGRLPVRETIEKARSTGNLNLATRSLPCIPSALFEVHLGVTPDPLKSVPNEPVLPPTPVDAPRRPGRKADQPSWYEAQDLTVLKVWNNEIEEIQHEISLFGSLKTFDAHKNRLTSLPSTLADLTALTTLDLSYNALTSLPENLFALPELANLNVSHNELTSFPLNAPFASGKQNAKKANSSFGSSFFAPTITRASSPLPRLAVLDISHNKITAGAIDLQFPGALTKANFSANPLDRDESKCKDLLEALSKLPRLKELRFEQAEIGDGALPISVFSSTSFPNIKVLDFGETKVTENAILEAFRPLGKQLSFVATTEEPPEGICSVTVGKKVIKEAWEIEVERQAHLKKNRHNNNDDFGDWEAPRKPAAPVQEKKQAAPASEKAPEPTKVANGAPKKAAPREVAKEAWEIEAEQGLLTEGGRRRARAQAAAAAAAANNSSTQSQLGVGKSPSSAPKSSSPPPNLSLSNPQYYSDLTQTLTLPPSNPPTKAPGHSRAFSMAASNSMSSSLRSADLVVPSPTLPLSVIVTQPFAHKLRHLILVNRRMDRSFLLPTSCEGLLPLLEELDLEGCGLTDTISVTRADATTNGDGSSNQPARSTEPLLPVLATLFPSLRTLNLSYNAITSAALTYSALSALILATSEKKGLKQLWLKGNEITDLDGFQTLAESFKGNRQVPEWHLDELDIRDNQVAKLPPELGLMPLDVFLVDGNMFRIPQRRVWEREGTKGLLSWLRGPCRWLEHHGISYNDVVNLAQPAFHILTPQPGGQYPTARDPPFATPQTVATYNARVHNPQPSPGPYSSANQNLPSFRAPAHKHAHHLHSIPPREKSTRTLIIDHMLWVHSRTRFAQARAELGMTDRTGGPSSSNYVHRKRPENYDEEEEEWSEGEDVSKLKARGDNIHDNPGDDEEERLQSQDLALARSLRLRAEGLEKVVTAMLGQPPPLDPIHDDDVLTPPTSPQMKASNSLNAPHPHTLPNGVRLRLALGTMINDLFARQAPIPPYRHQLQTVKSPSGQSPTESTSTYSAPDLFPAALTQLSTVSASCNPPPSTVSRPSPSHLSASPSSSASPSYLGYSPQSNLPIRPQSRITASQRVKRLYVQGADPSTANSPPQFRCPRHLHTGCQICVEAKTPTRPTGSSRNRSGSFGDFRTSSTNPWKGMPGGVGPGGGGISGWKDGSGVGSGLLRPGVRGNVLRRKSEEEDSEDAAVANGAGNTKLSDLIPRFIRLSALVAVELASEARDEEEAGLSAMRARENALQQQQHQQQNVTDWASTSAQAQQQQYRVLTPGGYQPPISPRHRIISPPPNPAQKQPDVALRPTREWYNILAGLLTRATLQGYLTAGWRGLHPVECLLTVGLGMAEEFDKDKEPPTGFEHFDPDGLPTLHEAARLLFPSLQVLAPPGKTQAEEEYESEMKERLRRFYDIPSSTPDLSTHMEDLAWQFPAEPVERAAVRFCEAIAKWRGKPELESYKKPATTTYDSFSTPGGSSISMESFVHASPPSAQRKRPSHRRRPSIEMYFTQPSLLQDGMWSRNKRPRSPEDSRAGGPSKRQHTS